MCTSSIPAIGAAERIIYFANPRTAQGEFTTGPAFTRRTFTITMAKASPAVSIPSVADARTRNGKNTGTIKTITYFTDCVRDATEPLIVGCTPDTETATRSARTVGVIGTRLIVTLTTHTGHIGEIATALTITVRFAHFTVKRTPFTLIFRFL